ncbi:MAG TPA: T9SS type A sorting domain-containing protein [bacterium]|nr:T9SS type A sorting domain-containing protein [bacterium]
MKKALWILSLSILFTILPADPGFCDGYLYSRFYPAAIHANGADPTTLEVFTTGSDIKEVQVFWHWYDPDWQILHDDGTHGDRAANDGIYTLNNLKALFNNFYTLFSHHHNYYGIHIKVIDTAGHEIIKVGQLGLVDSKTTYPAADLGGGCAATRSAFFITDTQGEIFAGYPLTQIACGSELFPKAYQKLYDRFEDVFDFIILMPETRLFEPGSYAERVPYCINVRNEIQHIGLPLFDESATCFSKGRLRSVIYHSFGNDAILDHEIGHSWGPRLGSTLGLLVGDNLPEGRYGHWLAEADVDGQMSYFIAGKTLADNGDGTWRLKPQDRDYMPYAPLELYAMGLIPAAEVPPVHILQGLDMTNPDKVTASSVRTVTMAEIMAAHGGVRIPAWPAAQKDFSAAFIFVSDRLFTAGELAYFSCIADHFASDEPGSNYSMPFETATGGRATLDVALPGMEHLTGIRTTSGLQPATLELEQNFPNPFNHATSITFRLDKPGQVALSVCDRLGREVTRLAAGYFHAGRHQVRWDASAQGTGLYWARLNSDQGVTTIKMVLIR